MEKASIVIDIKGGGKRIHEKVSGFLLIGIDEHGNVVRCRQDAKENELPEDLAIDTILAGNAASMAEYLLNNIRENFPGLDVESMAKKAYEASRVDIGG